MGFFIGIILGTLYMLVAFSNTYWVGLSKIKKEETLIQICEEHLTRDKHCHLTAIPDE